MLVDDLDLRPSRESLIGERFTFGRAGGGLSGPWKAEAATGAGEGAWGSPAAEVVPTFLVPPSGGQAPGPGPAVRLPDASAPEVANLRKARAPPVFLTGEPIAAIRDAVDADAAAGAVAPAPRPSSRRACAEVEAFEAVPGFLRPVALVGRASLEPEVAAAGAGAGAGADALAGAERLFEAACDLALGGRMVPICVGLTRRLTLEGLGTLEVVAVAVVAAGLAAVAVGAVSAAVLGVAFGGEDATLPKEGRGILLGEGGRAVTTMCPSFVGLTVRSACASPSACGSPATSTALRLGLVPSSSFR